MIKKSVYLCLVIAMIMSGCATTEYSIRKLQAPLDGDWKSTASKITLSFKDGKISGSDGCNHFEGVYSSDGVDLEIFKSSIVTNLSCDEEIIKIGDSFRKSLTEVRHYKNDGKFLKLLAENGEEIGEFRAISNSFDEGKYTVQSLSNEKKAVIALKAGVSISIELSGDGKISGFTGCNRFSAVYTLHEDKISISAPTITHKMCPIDNTRAEQSFMEVMKNGVRISRNGERWEIRDASNLLLMDMIKN